MGIDLGNLDEYSFFDLQLTERATGYVHRRAGLNWGNGQGVNRTRRIYLYRNAFIMLTPNSSLLEIAFLKYILMMGTRLYAKWPKTIEKLFRHAKTTA